MLDLRLGLRACAASVCSALAAGVLAAAGAGPAAAAAVPPAPGTHYFLTSSTASAPAADAVFAVARADDAVLTGDWDGNGTSTLAVRRGATYLLTSRIGGPTTTTVGFGRPDDVALVGDWDGDGRDSLGVRRGNVFHLTGRPGGPVVATVGFGRPDDTVVVGDWNGDGKDTLGVRRGSSYLLTDALSGGATRTVGYGATADAHLVGDWDGDRRDTLGVRRPVVTVAGTGTFQVGSQAGSQVRPGTYRASLRAGAAECWWDAYDVPEHEGAEPVAGDFISAVDRETSIYAEVRPGDRVFDTEGCTTWTLVTGADLPALRTLTDGRWRVGKDVAAGTWVVDVPAGSGCIWARTRDFRWTDDSFLDAAQESSSAHRVTLVVGARDAGVASVGCGSWRRLA